MNPFDRALEATLFIGPLIPCPECGRPLIRPHPACRAYVRVLGNLGRVRAWVKAEARQRPETEREVRERFPTVAVAVRAYGQVMVDIWKGVGG